MKYTQEQICKAGHTTPRGIRLWESQGLLGKVGRSEKGHRYYTIEHFRRAKIIAVCQFVGHNLNDTGGILENYTFEKYQILQKALYQKIKEAKDMTSYLPSPEFDL